MAKQTRIEFVAALLVFCVMKTSSQDLKTLKIEPRVRNLLVGIGSELVLDCSITFPENERLSPSILSWKGPEKSTFISKTRTDNEEQTVSYHNLLTIDSFSKNDVGTYVCKFSGNGSSVGATETNIEIITVIEHKIESDYSYGNKSVVLECTLEFPETEISGKFKEWLKDNTSLSQQKNPERFIDSENGTLVIHRPTRTDSGLYVARYEVTGVASKTYDCEVVYSAAPLVLDMARSKNLVEGDTLHLECVVKGYPHASITWLRNNVTIEKDKDRITMDEFHGYENAKLTIRSTKFSDEGNYTCVAIDKIGRRASKSITVRIKDQLDWLWPVIGILCEAVVLALVIFACSKIKKDDHVEKPADEREGLLRQGSSRGHNKDE